MIEQEKNMTDNQFCMIMGSIWFTCSLLTTVAWVKVYATSVALICFSFLIACFISDRFHRPR